jgi:hypothetical protein
MVDPVLKALSGFSPGQAGIKGKLQSSQEAAQFDRRLASHPVMAPVVCRVDPRAMR